MVIQSWIMVSCSLMMVCDSVVSSRLMMMRGNLMMSGSLMMLNYCGYIGIVKMVNVSYDTPS